MKIKDVFKINTFLLFLIVGFVAIEGCNKLEQYPKSNLSPETFFKTEADLQSYTNRFYKHIVPDALDVYYTVSGNADDQAVTNASRTIKGNRLIPNTGGGWSWNNLREINFYFEHSHQANDEDIRLHYDGVAHFFRAWFYYKKLRRFGDVPWYSTTVGSRDEEKLMKPRDSRVLIVDSILADLDFAIENLPDNQDINKVTKWTALALKSRVTLFEGTFREYHQNDVFGKDTKGNTIGDGKDLLEACVEASKNLMENSSYSIYKGSGPNSAYAELFLSDDAIPQEVILAKSFNDKLDLHYNANFRTISASYGRPGLTKSFVNSYLMKSGTRFTDKTDYNKIEFADEVQDRDPRLSQTIRTAGYTYPGQSKQLVPQLGSSITGYQWSKYITGSETNNGGINTNDLPIFRYAEVLLNFAEAKAELGTLTQDDLNKSIKPIRERVGMPNINLSYANANPDSYLADQYVNVKGANKGVILEIRRERRIELTREGFRFWDLMRWSEGHLLSDVFKGMYIPGVGNYDLDNDGQTDLIVYSGSKPGSTGDAQVYSLDELNLDNGTSGLIIANPDFNKKFNPDKDYLYPIPVEERLLNKNLKQNPGWNDGID